MFDGMLFVIKFKFCNITKLTGTHAHDRNFEHNLAHGNGR
jgi:hypothetical protein